MRKENNLLPVYLAVTALLFFFITACTGGKSGDAGTDSKTQPDALEMNLRSRVKAGGDVWQVKQEREQWDPSKTAIIISDMWDRHWCESATQRVAELAPSMNEVIKEARKKGITIIHAPSGTMDYYAGYTQRKKAIELPHHAAPEGIAINEWCYLDLDAEEPLPIDDTDGGCDKPCASGAPCKEHSAWSSQVDLIDIYDEDYISDRGQEVYNLIMEKGIDNVIMMGVHTNMCVLGRPFAIRQLSKLGKNVVLMRDMTDSMYNPEREPYVSHFEGTNLVVEHIEKFWAPSVLSSDITGKDSFAFAESRN